MEDNTDSISDVICVFLQCFYLYGLKINYTMHMISISFPLDGKKMPINDSIYNYLDFS